jgi:hypothetical protein
MLNVRVVYAQARTLNITSNIVIFVAVWMQHSNFSYYYLEDLPIDHALAIVRVVYAQARALNISSNIVIFVAVWKRHSDSSYCYLEDPPKPVQPVGIPDWEGRSSISRYLYDLVWFGGLGLV